MEFSKLQNAVYAQSWVENYLTAMVADMPQHKDLLSNYLIVSQALTTLRRESNELASKITDAQNALNK